MTARVVPKKAGLFWCVSGGIRVRGGHDLVFATLFVARCLPLLSSAESFVPLVPVPRSFSRTSVS